MGAEPPYVAALDLDAETLARWIASGRGKGFTHKLSAETVWLLNRQALADRWHCPPYEVDRWPMYEVVAALRMLEIEAEGEKRRPKKRT
jgi:hypothetical protein